MIQLWGTENRRGYCKPNKSLIYPKVFLCQTPSVARMQTLSVVWVMLVLLRNYVLNLAVVGLLHVWLYRN